MVLPLCLPFHIATAAPPSPGGTGLPRRLTSPLSTASAMTAHLVQVASKVFLPSFAGLCLFRGWLVWVDEQASPLVLTYFWLIFQEETHGPFLTVFLWYFSLLLLLLVSTPVNTSCDASFSQLQLWTLGGIAP